MNPLVVLFIAFFLLVAIRVPVAYALALSSALIIWLEGLNLNVFVNQMYLGLNSFTLLAVPFFLLAGQLLNAGNITDAMIRFSQALVGHIRGGLAHVNVVVSMLFAGMSGSSTADTAGVGSVLIPAMIRRGFDRNFSIALTAASSTMGVIIPPSILMVVYGAMGGVSIGALFLAGAIPGALIALSQMTYAYIYAVRRGHDAEPLASPREFVSAAKSAFLPLLTPVILIGGVLSGQFTATESGLVAVLYLLVLVFVFYRSARLSSLFGILGDSVVIYSQVLFAVAAATLFGWLLAYFEMPQMVVDLIEGHTSNPIFVAFFVAAVYLVAGTFLDAVPAIIIFLPIITRLVAESGASPIHIGLVAVMTLAMGLITPPYGLCLLLASAIGKQRVTRVLPQMLIFYALFIGILTVVILVPEISLFLPRLVMPEVVR